MPFACFCVLLQTKSGELDFSKETWRRYRSLKHLAG